MKTNRFIALVGVLFSLGLSAYFAAFFSGEDFRRVISLVPRSFEPPHRAKIPREFIEAKSHLEGGPVSEKAAEALARDLSKMVEADFKKQNVDLAALKKKGFKLEALEDGRIRVVVDPMDPAMMESPLTRVAAILQSHMSPGAPEKISLYVVKNLGEPARAVEDGIEVSEGTIRRLASLKSGSESDRKAYDEKMAKLGSCSTR